MPGSEDCRFCRILEGQQFNGLVDEPFVVCSDYVSVASVGALVEGWSLIVPRQHCMSLRNHYSSASFQRFARSVIQRVESEYGPTVIFEHGANHKGSLTSCGTDHAHLHIVPRQFSLPTLLASSGVSEWQQVRASEIQSFAKEGEYLYFSTEPNTDDPIGYFRKVEDPLSQFFRKAIAAAIGRTEVSDYKKFPLLDTSLKTRERLLKAA